MSGERDSVSVRRRAGGTRRGRGGRRRARARAAARREARGTRWAAGGRRSRAQHTWRTAPRPAAPTLSRAPVGCSPAQRRERERERDYIIRD